MTDPITMAFSLNQAALNNAIAAALPSLLKELEFDYTSGRPPKGLTAQVTISESMIRKAVESYARRTVNAQFTHFGIEFQATRGEDGILANITASTAPIAPEEPKAAQASTSAKQSEAQAEVSQATVSAEEAQGSVGEAEASVNEAAEQTEVQPEAASTEAEVEASKGEDAATEAPAPARSKLFGDLKRPSNEASE